MKRCPFCAEEIQEEAIKCRFCNEFFDGRERAGSRIKNKEWFFKTSTLVLGFCVAGPLIIPLIWFNPHYSKQKKIILIGICLVITILAVKVIKTSLTSIDEYYQLIQGNY